MLRELSPPLITKDEPEKPMRWPFLLGNEPSGYQSVLQDGSSDSTLDISPAQISMHEENQSDIECQPKEANDVVPDMADATLDSDNDLDPQRQQQQVVVDLQIQDEQQSQPLIKTPPPELMDDPMAEAEMDLQEGEDEGCCAKCCRPCAPCVDRLDRLDKKLSNYIFKSSPGKVMDVIIAIGCLAFSYFGFPLWIVLYVVIYESYLYALCVLVSIVVTQIMKRCFKRPRPKISDLGERWFYLQFEDVSSNHSFPSGDTAQAAVFAVTLGYTVSYWYFLGVITIVPYAALGRIYYGRHYIGDTIGGAITGISIGYFTNWFLVNHMWRLDNYS